MKIYNNVSLRDLNTFKIDVKADFFSSVKSLEDYNDIMNSYSHHNNILLGGGSNILFINDIHGLVIKNDISGIRKIDENTHYIWIDIGSGENWHDLVLYTISNGWSGLENLSLIPGTVGAAPIQNIGAYGTELKACFHSLRAIDKTSGKIVQFNKEDCEFGYRSSVFKTKFKDTYFITSVILRLSKSFQPNIAYGSLKKTIEMMDQKPSAKSVSDAVIKIRESKLPDPEILGNAGSFFKNPVISKELFDSLSSKFQDMPHYNLDEGTYKIPAGWLIEKSGWKGRRLGDVGVHDKQALVLVNYGNGTGKEILNLAHDIKESVRELFGITLQPEVNII
ncbi:MAG TPA: UDP-N-acetylmuramate dehydrogenase [Cyclobacteriaceae bacterium]